MNHGGSWLWLVITTRLLRYTICLLTYKTISGNTSVTAIVITARFISVIRVLLYKHLSSINLSIYARHCLLNVVNIVILLMCSLLHAGSIAPLFILWGFSMSFFLEYCWGLRTQDVAPCKANYDLWIWAIQIKLDWLIIDSFSHSLWTTISSMV